MPSPARAARRALPAASLLACAMLCACDAGAGGCPGDAAAALALTGTRTLEPDPGAPGLPACGAAVGYADDGAFTLAGTLSDAAGASGAAFCPQRDKAADLFGAREALTYEVSAVLGGAVLGGCGGGCAPTLELTLRGTLAPGTAGAPGSFTGTWVERLDAPPGTCGACVIPCLARYDVSGEALPR